MKTFYMSFVDHSRPEGERWLGACLVQAESVGDATHKAWEAGCNPGGEILFVEPEREPDIKWFYRLLTKDDLLEMGAEIMAKYNLPAEDNVLLNTKGEVVGRMN